MKRETLEWMTAKAIANQEYLDLNFGSCIGSFYDLKEYCWKEFCEETFDKNVPDYGSPEYEKWKRNEINQFAKKFAKENNIKNTKIAWMNNSYELSGYSWYESDKEFAKMLLENDYFCDLSDEELIEEYYKYA